MAVGTLGTRARGDATSPFRHVDVVLVVCVAAIAALGTLMVFSSTRGTGPAPDTSYLRRELAFMTLGGLAMVAVSAFDYRKLFNYVWLLYGGALLLLVLVISPLGQESKGAQAWFGFGPFQLQPAEFAKLALIGVLAALLSHYEGDIDPRRLGVLLGVAGAPMALILLQPDLGMVLIYVAILMGMLLVGGVRGRHILALSLLGVVAVIGVFNSNVLKQYQKDRLTAFVNPESDARATTYNINQSTTAIGNGGITGRGLFKGQQTQYQFVPEQETDFIFTAVGEELGFVGAATLLVLYGIVIWRIWRTALLAKDWFGRLLCVGVLSFLVFQIFENVGMTMQIMPVTGIPLPLMSYGGSSIVTTFLALGLVLSVHMHRFR
ncbi:MAG: rod shape-determining protein RodA [Acidimicrobiales bacterium]|nr:rod shape-determining protein RodA [Acidimicrobiales bacterium]